MSLNPRITKFYLLVGVSNLMESFGSCRNVAIKTELVFRPYFRWRLISAINCKFDVEFLLLLSYFALVAIRLVLYRSPTHTHLLVLVHCIVAVVSCSEQLLM